MIGLEVKGPGPRGVPDRIYYLHADSREEMEVWHKHLMEVADLQLCRKDNGTFLSINLLLGSASYSVFSCCGLHPGGPGRCGPTRDSSQPGADRRPGVPEGPSYPRRGLRHWEDKPGD